VSLEHTDLTIAHALAELAAVAVAHQHALLRAEQINEQLKHALRSRVIIEQAKGKLAQQGSLEMEAAFLALRRHARDTNQKLRVVAGAVIEGTLTLQHMQARDRR
jgi:AmiR/NasT family two-component response regulator